MKDGDYEYHHIKTYDEFNEIKSLLVGPLEETVKHTRTVKTANELLNEIESNIKVGNNNFGLFIILSHGEIVVFITLKLYIDDNCSLCCMIHGKYFKQGYMRQLAPIGLKILEDWAIERHCDRMMFITSRNGKAYLRLLNGHGFKFSNQVFERRIIQ